MRSSSHALALGRHRIGAYTAPVAMVLPLLDLVQRWRVQPDDLLRGAGLSFSELEDPLARLEMRTVVRLFENARLLTGEPALGYYLAPQKRVSMFGHIGFVAQSARTVGEVLALGAEVRPPRVLRSDLRIADAGQLGLALSRGAHVARRRARRHSHQRPDGATDHPDISHRDQRSVPHRVRLPEPAYYARFAHMAPNTHFGQPFNRVEVSQRTLDLPVVTADSTALRVARKVCERALEELGDDTEWIEQVRRAIPRAEGGFRRVDQVAELLHVSPRTMKRRLELDGSSYSSSSIASGSTQPCSSCIPRASRST